MSIGSIWSSLKKMCCLRQSFFFYYSSTIGASVCLDNKLVTLNYDSKRAQMHTEPKPNLRVF